MLKWAIFKTHLSILETESRFLRKEDKSLLEQAKELSKQINELGAKRELVLSQLAQKEVKKDSHNSPNPLSEDKSTPKK
ncbi:MAG: hypothetical protein V3V00_09745 [Saprospiraceae bacterium]